MFSRGFFFEIAIGVHERQSPLSLDNEKTSFPSGKSWPLSRYLHLCHAAHTHLVSLAKEPVVLRLICFLQRVGVCEESVSIVPLAARQS